MGARTVLKALTIQDLAVVRQVDVEFGPGLTVLTGETGAGKSILVGALGLALGDRADPAIIRTGADRATVAATFDIGANPAAQALLAEHGLEQDGECILRRAIGSDGRSRAFCNAAPVSVQLLKEIGEQLVGIHGQHAHHSLLQRAVQRATLDEYGRLSSQVAKVNEAYRAWQALARELAALHGDHGDPASRADFLQFQLGELESLNASREEFVKTEAEYRRLAHASRLREGCAEIATRVFEAERCGLRLVTHGHASLRELALLDPGLASVAEMFDQAIINLAEAERELAHYREQLESHPADLERLERRLQAIHDAARKHRCEPAALGEVTERIRQELADLMSRGARAEALAEAVAAAKAQYAALAAALGQGRRAKALAMNEAITAHLHDLGMPHGRFTAELTDAADAAAHGLDEVEFLVTTNPDQAPRPLRKVASGGELSRISLAIQVATAGVSGVPVLVYDEVDTGIGGRVAAVVARHLQLIASGRQVLCITHLARIASAGGRHLTIGKTFADGTTTTAVRYLSADERVEEVARMLGGERTSERSLAHARELLAG